MANHDIFPNPSAINVIDATALGINAGDTVTLDNVLPFGFGIKLVNFTFPANNPVTIRALGAKAVIVGGADYALTAWDGVNGSRPSGIVFDNLHFQNRLKLFDSDHIKARYCWLDGSSNTSAGLSFKPYYQPNTVQTSLLIEDCLFTDFAGNYALYVGDGSNGLPSNEGIIEDVTVRYSEFSGGRLVINISRTRSDTIIHNCHIHDIDDPSDGSTIRFRNADYVDFLRNRIEELVGRGVLIDNEANLDGSLIKQFSIFDNLFWKIARGATPGYDEAIRSFNNLASPIYIERNTFHTIKADPHNSEGVAVKLQSQFGTCRYNIISDCGNIELDNHLDITEEYNQFPQSYDPNWFFDGINGDFRLKHDSNGVDGSSPVDGYYGSEGYVSPMTITNSFGSTVIDDAFTIGRVGVRGIRP